ncbi:MAG: sulfatase-like hydrolase/transferase [Bacteroidota bacterium]
MIHKLFKLTLAILFACTFIHLQAQYKLKQHPNVVIILADDLGYGDLSCFGQKNWQTPNIDKLAEEGSKLTSMYTPVPYCEPTRDSLLTGSYPQRHKLVLNPNPEKTSNFQKYRGGDSIGLQESEYLLSQLLKSYGYTNKIIGKWHLGHQAKFLPLKRVFDEYLGMPYSNDMRPVILLENEKVIEYPVVQSTLTKRYTQL